MDSIPPHLPEPPVDLNLLELLAERITLAEMFRMHDQRHDALHWNWEHPSDRGRFNAPAGQFGVLYLASSPACAYAESGHGRDISETRLASRRMSAVEVNNAKLIDLTGGNLVRMGIDNHINTIRDYPLCQRWALALWSHPLQVDGLIYVPRTDPELRSVVLFDRARHMVNVTSTVPLAEHAGFPACVERYGISIVPG